MADIGRNSHCLSFLYSLLMVLLLLCTHFRIILWIEHNYWAFNQNSIKSKHETQIQFYWFVQIF